MSYYNQMSPFWDFVADLEERGRSHPWFGGRGGGRGPAARAANRGEAAEGNTQQPNPWTEGAAFGWPMGQMPHRHRHGHAHGHGHGHGPGRRGGRRQQQQREAAAEPEATGVLTPDTEKEAEVLNEKAPVEEVLFDAEKPAAENEGRRGPGLRRGGRGGRGAGMGRGRGFGPRARAQALNNEAPKVAVEDATEKPAVEEQTRRGPGARRGLGPRGGPGRGMGRGMGRGGRFAARHAALNHPEMFAGPWGPAFAPWHPAFGPFGPAAFGPHGHGFGPHGGRFGPRRGGPGAGRGRGAGLAQARNVGAEAPNAGVGNGPRRGPGARRGGPGARGGRGMGAGRGRGAGMGRRGPAGLARAVGEESTPNAEAFAPRPRAGPASRRQNQGPNAAQPSGPRGGRGGMRDGPRAQRQAEKRANGKFRPDIDVFDHAEAFVIHASLPGAKKDEIEVNWDSEKSILSISGHVDRTRDEELLKTVVKDERKVGDFQRRIRLGRWVTVTPVDVDGIMATMEDGVLRIEVPKMDAGFVEVKKVDIK